MFFEGIKVYVILIDIFELDVCENLVDRLFFEILFGFIGVNFLIVDKIVV